MKQQAKKTVNYSVRMPQVLHNEISLRADKLQMSLGALVRTACRQFNEKTVHVDNCKKLVLQSKLSDMQQIKFAGMRSNTLSLYLHRNAFPDPKNADKKVEDAVMDFMRSSIDDGTLISKGDIKSDDGANIILFRVNKVDVYCQFGPGQITILSVV